MDNDFSDEAPDISIHSGFPNPAADKRLHNLDFNQLLVANPSSTFLFRVRGEHGNRYGIFDGDTAVIDRALTPISSGFLLWHDGRHFKISRTSSIAADSTIWGIVTAIIHSYRRNIMP